MLAVQTCRGDEQAWLASSRGVSAVQACRGDVQAGLASSRGVSGMLGGISGWTGQ